jgi:hypothetical protein
VPVLAALPALAARVCEDSRTSGWCVDCWKRRSTMEMTMKHLMFAALIAAGCGGKKDDGGGGGGTTDNGKDPAASGLPAELSGWMPANAKDAWQGAWSTRMTLRETKTMSMAGLPAALEVSGDKAKGFDGKDEHQLGFAVASPCTASFTQQIGGGATASHTKTFLIRDGKLQVGEGAAGYRKGKTAIVCTPGMDGIFVVDDKGCVAWSKRFDKWDSKPSECAWSSDGGKDMLSLGKGDWARKVVAEGDVLVSDQFVEETKLTTKAGSYDEAKADVIAKVKEKDPGEQAKAAGGEVGKTDTVASLAATYAADSASLDGKPLEITALYFSSGSMTSNGKTTRSLTLIDSKEQNKITLSCYLAGEIPAGLKQYDKVTVKGTVKESFGTAALEDCVAEKAN